MRLLLGSILAAIVALSPVGAQQKPEGSYTKPKQEAEKKAPDMADMAAMMEAYMKYAAPSEHHDKLHAMVGKWNIAGKFRMSPDMPWMESNGDAEFESVLGGRFVLQKVHTPPSQMIPDHFYGINYIGYDNYQKKYVSMWIDTMSTMMIVSSGESSEDGSISLHGHYMDPMSGTEKPYKWVYHTTDDGMVLKMYEEPQGGGEMFHSAEIVYTKQ